MSQLTLQLSYLNPQDGVRENHIAVQIDRRKGLTFGNVLEVF